MRRKENLSRGHFCSGQNNVIKKFDHERDGKTGFCMSSMDDECSFLRGF